MTKRSYSPHLQSFLATFGEDEAAVVAEIRAIWQREGGFLPPPELFGQLIDARVKAGSIATPRAQFLKDYVGESFAPEQTTGYFQKHRAPLSESLAALYVEQFPDQPLYRIGGDAINLGGLNLAVPDRALADRLFGTLTDDLASDLGALGHVTAIRSGGDELTFYLSPKAGITEPAVKEALLSAQDRMAILVKEAGISQIPHPKYADKSGFGIGLGYVEMHRGSPLMQQQLLELRIQNGKEAFYTELHFGADPKLRAMPEPSRVKAALDAHARSHPPRPGRHYGYVFGSADKAPDEARYAYMVRHFGSCVDGAITAVEERALQGVHACTQALDEVTGLPLFAHMQGEQLPNFARQHGSSGIRLAHIDFSNMAAGNLLGDWVGDAMGRAYADATLDALDRTDLGHLKPYLAASPGGKFALAVAADMPENFWEGFKKNLKAALAEASTRPLPLNPEQLTASRAKITGDPVLQKRYGHNGSGLGEAGIRMDALINPKTSLSGTQLAMALSEPINPRAPLGEVMGALEHEAQWQHTAMTAARLNAAGPPQSPSHSMIPARSIEGPAETGLLQGNARQRRPS